MLATELKDKEWDSVTGFRRIGEKLTSETLYHLTCLLEY